MKNRIFVVFFYICFINVTYANTTFKTYLYEYVGLADIIVSAKGIGFTKTDDGQKCFIVKIIDIVKGTSETDSLLIPITAIDSDYYFQEMTDTEFILFGFLEKGKPQHICGFKIYRIISNNVYVPCKYVEYFSDEDNKQSIDGYYDSRYESSEYVRKYSKINFIYAIKIFNECYKVELNISSGCMTVFEGKKIVALKDLNKIQAYKEINIIFKYLTIQMEILNIKNKKHANE